MSSKKEKFARIGILSKGVVYGLIGTLTALAAFNLGGSKSGKGNALEFIAGQPFGKVLLGALAVGLFGYTFYRFYEAIKGIEESWSDAKGFTKRIGYIVSGIFYGFLGYTAATIAIGSSSGSGDSSMVSSIMSKSYGPYLIGIVALAMLGKSVFQIYKAYSNKFRDDVKESNLSQNQQSVFIKAGKIGFVSRGIVSGIIAFLLFKVAIGSGGSADGKVAAFEFLQDTFGAVVMGLVALGLVAYAVFMFIQAKYPQIKI